MLTDEEILQDLEKLKDIVAVHKSPDAPLATHSTVIDGIEYDVFSKVPSNLNNLYELGLAAGEKTFLVYNDERLTFSETLTLSRRLARTLLESYNIKLGDRVAICARNSPEWCISYMAATMIGAVVVPMNSWWKGPEIEYGLNDSASKVLFIDPDRLAQLVPHLDNVEVTLVIITPEQDGGKNPGFYSLIDGVLPLTSDEIAAIRVEPESNATIMYTSGSTGMPKGVLSTHRNIINALYTWCFVKEITEILRPELVEENPEFDPAILANVPLFHVTGSHAQFLACFIYMRKFVMMFKWDA